MAGTTIGEVNISLRMNLAQFKKDVQDGTSAASVGTQQMASVMRSQTMEARGTLMLLGEEIGVHVPRHLGSLIASLPGVGAALSAAFSSVAVLALIEVIVKVAEKISELKKHAEDFQKAVDESGTLGTQKMRQLDEEVLKLQGEFDKLSGHTMKALKEEIQALDMETLDKITKQFEDMDKAAKKALDDLKVSGFADFFGMGNNEQVKNAKDDLDAIIKKVHELQAAGDNAGIGKLLDEQIGRLKSYKDVAYVSDPHPEVRQKALNYEFQQLTQLKAEYDRTNEAAKLHTEILEKNASKSLEQEAGAVDSLRIKYQDIVNTFTPDPLDKVFERARKAEDEIRKMAAENPALFKKAFPNDSVDTVVAAMQRFAKQAEDLEMIKALKAINQELAVMGKEVKLPDLGALNLPVPTLAKDATTPTTDQEELIKISAQTTAGEKAAAAEARKVVDSIETQNQKFKDQVAILNELKRQGLLTQQQFSQAMQLAAANTDRANKLWDNLGKTIGQDIAQAAIMNKSWSDAIKNIIVQVIELIVQMTILKKLQDSLGGGSGAGGFFSGLVGSIFGGHRAGGGYVDSSHAYMVGENGPEMFMPSGSGSIVPNGALQGGNSTQVNYHIDARGADAGVEQRLRAAIAESEGRAVARAVITTQEISKRRIA